MDHRPRQERSRDRANQGIAAFISASTNTRRSAAVSAVQYVRTCLRVQAVKASESVWPASAVVVRCARVGTTTRLAHPLADLPPSDGLSHRGGPEMAKRRSVQDGDMLLPLGVLGVISGVDAILPPKMVVTASSGVAAVVASAMTTVRRTTIVAVAASALPAALPSPQVATRAPLKR